MAEPLDERRNDDRAPITLRVDYKRLNTFFADYTKNISKGGTFIRTTRPLALGTQFKFVLSVPSVPAPNPDGTPRKARDASPTPPASVELELEGIVKWIVSEAEATKAEPAGMGIQFIFDNDDDRRQVEELVANMMRDTLGKTLAAKLLGRDDEQG